MATLSMYRFPTPEAIADLALAAIDASVRPESWRELCNRIAAGADARAFIVMAYDLNHHSIPQLLGSDAIHSPAAVALSDAARTGEGVEDLLIYQALSRQPAGKVISEFDLAPAPEQLLAANPWRERMLAVTGGKARSVMKINDVGPYLDCVAIHDSFPHDGPLPMGRIAPLVFPIVARTLETMRIVSSLVESYDRLMALFDQLDFGAAFCTHDGKVVTSNRTFRFIAGERDGLWEVSHGLQTGAASDTQALLNLFTAAGKPDAGPGQLTLAIPRRSGRRPLVVRAVPTRNHDVSARSVVLLLVIDPEDTSRLNTRGLEALGVLTPAELQVCDLLVQGFDTAEISDHRSTSRDTTRDQIKAACSKLACRSRLDLLRLAMATSAPDRQ